MIVSFQDDAWEDYLYWQQAAGKKILKRINTVIKDINRNPSGSIGKPEPLKHDLSDYWSRRVDQEHRVVYRSDKKNTIVVACRYHY